MSEKEKLYLVKLAIKGNLNDVVKVQAEKLENIPKEHKVLSYKLVQNKK